MKMTLAVLTALLSGASMAKGLACGQGAMTPMEARLERASGNKSAESTRIQNTQCKSAQLQREVPDAVPSGSKVSTLTVSKPCSGSKQTTSGCCGAKSSCQKVRKSCCKSTQTVTSGCSAKSGGCTTKGGTASAAQSSKACGKATR